MSSKYIIEEVDDLDVWQQSIENTPQYSMFVSRVYLESFGGRYKLFSIKKGEEPKAWFCILLSNDEEKIVLDDLVIYSGIFFKEDLTQKEVKAKSERFELTDAIIVFLAQKYKKIEMALSTKIEDMRPFLWYNYGSNKKNDIFELDLRYTSYIDISELKDFNNEEDTQLFKNLETLRQRNIRQARKDNSITSDELHVDLFLEYYKKLMNSQGEDVPESKLTNMANIITNTVKNKDAVMFATKNGNGDIIYLTVFTYDEYRAYYLFGAGNPDSCEHYKGTVCFWDAFIRLAQAYGVKEVDMEGINSPQRGWFKLGFGGSIVPYYEIRLGE
jgi:hypothetical protein